MSRIGEGQTVAFRVQDPQKEADEHAVIEIRRNCSDSRFKIWPGSVQVRNQHMEHGPDAGIIRLGPTPWPLTSAMANASPPV